MKNNHTTATTKTTISQHNVMTRTTATNKWRTFNHHCVGCSGAGSLYSKFVVFLFDFLEPSVSCSRLFYLVFHLVLNVLLIFIIYHCFRFLSHLFNLLSSHVLFFAEPKTKTGQTSRQKNVPTEGWADKRTDGQADKQTGK